MPRPINEAERESTIQQIKATARELMAERGTAGIAMRPIAKRMGMTAPALYHYFGNLDELITALLVDAFNSLADHMGAADTAHQHDGTSVRLLHVLETFRGWALENPVDFDLTNGNPIPGYHAPGEVTIPAASRVLEVPITTIAEGMARGEFTFSLDAEGMGDDLQTTLASMRENQGLDAPPEALYLAVVGWTQAAGIIALELHNQLQPVMWDTAAFFRHRMRVLISQITGSNLNNTI